MSIKGQGHSLTLVKGHSDFKVKCLTFGLYTQVSDSGPQGPLVSILLYMPSLYIYVVYMLLYVLLSILEEIKISIYLLYFAILG